MYFADGLLRAYEPLDVCLHTIRVDVVFASSRERVDLAANSAFSLLSTCSRLLMAAAQPRRVAISGSASTGKQARWCLVQHSTGMATRLRGPMACLGHLTQ